MPELNRPLGDVLLTPTRIYAKQILALVKEFPIKGIAHITGGGITENLPRIFPQGVRARIDRTAWTIPPIFQALSRLGEVEREEMYRVFNMGIGLILVVPASIGSWRLEESRRAGRPRLADRRNRGLVRGGTGGGICRLSGHLRFA